MSVNLRMKVLAPLVLFTILQSAYLYLVWMPHSIENSESDYQRSLELHLDSVVEGLIPLLLSHQLDAIHENLNALLEKNTDWTGLRLTDEANRTLYPLAPPLPNARRTDFDVHVLEKKIQHLGKRLGVLTVSVDFGPRLAEMKQRYRELGTVLLIVTIVFSFFVGTVLDRVFVAPVRAVSAASQRLAKGDFDAPLEEGGGDDEVGQLIGRFAEMRESIKNHQSELLERNRLVQRSQEHLAEAQRIAHVGSWELNAVTRELVWSAEVFRIFGVEPQSEAVRYSVFLEQVHPNDRQLVNDAYSGCLADVAPFNVIHRIVRKSDNTVRYVQEKCEVIHDDHGGIQGARGTIHDISDLKLAEAAVLESENKLRSITNAAQDAILMLDAQGRISYWNPAAEQIFQYRTDEAIGRELHVLLAPSRFHAAYRAGFSRFQNTGEGPVINRSFEMTARKKDGAEFPVEVSVSAFNVNGQWNAVGIVRDITERSKLEAQLRQSQKMEAIGQLAGGIAHDFNNLLSAIMGYGQMVNKKMAPDDPLKLYMGYLLESADRAAYLTRSLLAFSRKQIIKLAVADLNDIIGKMEKFLRRIIGEDVELKTVLRRDSLNINADRSQIEQVLMNLATNSRDAMPRGGRLTLETDVMAIDDAFIRAHGYGEAGHYAVITVTDNGTGMDEETQKKIFEPFFTTKEVGKGTGLGLSMVYGIVKQHRGFVNVYSEPDKGTTFRVYLPLVKADMREDAPHETDAARELPRGHETVLLAEDDEAVRRLSRIALAEAGYRVIEAVDGEDAIAKFETVKEDAALVILDVIMPKKNGKDAFERIRASRPDIKVIFVSGYTADKILADGVLDDDAPLLLKPLSPSTLLVKVREALDKK